MAAVYGAASRVKHKERSVLDQIIFPKKHDYFIASVLFPDDVVRLTFSVSWDGSESPMVKGRSSSRQEHHSEERAEHECKCTAEENGWTERTGLVIKFKQINPKNTAIHCRCRDLQCKHEAGDSEPKLTTDRNFPC